MNISIGRAAILAAAVAAATDGAIGNRQGEPACQPLPR